MERSEKEKKKVHCILMRIFGILAVKIEFIIGREGRKEVWFKLNNVQKKAMRLRLRVLLDQEVDNSGSNTENDTTEAHIAAELTRTAHLFEDSF